MKRVIAVCFAIALGGSLHAQGDIGGGSGSIPSPGGGIDSFEAPPEFEIHTTGDDSYHDDEDEDTEGRSVAEGGGYTSYDDGVERCTWEWSFDYVMNEDDVPFWEFIDGFGRQTRYKQAWATAKRANIDGMAKAGDRQSFALTSVALGEHGNGTFTIWLKSALDGAENCTQCITLDSKPSFKARALKHNPPDSSAQANGLMRITGVNLQITAEAIACAKIEDAGGGQFTYTFSVYGNGAQYQGTSSSLPHDTPGADNKYKSDDIATETVTFLGVLECSATADGWAQWPAWDWGEAKCSIEESKEYTKLTAECKGGCSGSVTIKFGY